MMKLQIAGPGCYNCKLLAERVEAAAQELGFEYEIEKVENVNAIVAMGILRALAVDGQVKLAGGVPSLAEMKEILSA